MVYLCYFKLLSIFEENSFFNGFKRTCFNSFYPFRLFPEVKELQEIIFNDITIFSGGNGSGKSTLLNIISEKLQLKRKTPYNKTYFFNPYIENCSYQLELYDSIEIKRMLDISKIISSDDVFNYIIDVRVKNENIDFKRKLIFDEKSNLTKYGWHGPNGFDANDSKSMKRYSDYYKISRQSASRFVKENVGEEERTLSNGEYGFKYFTDAIQPGGLYLLDEPENSLSAEFQLKLAQFILAMTRFYDCQFIISTHSPFILSLSNAKIYNMDSTPVSICKWTELPNVRLYYDFFRDNMIEFELNDL